MVKPPLDLAAEVGVARVSMMLSFTPP